ncbi:MAG TPA: glycosyltransferase family 2 protein [Rhodothermales bacterium]|nr:glycosyltransferase family 2 protein [Rhodothermales bacterium]
MMATRRETVALIIPLYDEEEVFPYLFDRVESYRTAHPEVVEVVFVDDGSRDRTAALVREMTAGRPGYTMLQFSRNFGHQIAITAGMHVVTADAAVIMDADLQDPFSVVTEMIGLWREGYDVVYGIRKERQGETLFKRTATYAFYRFFQRLTDLDAPLDTGDFRLISRAVLDAYRRINDQQPYVRGLIAWLGFNQTGIEYVRPPRAAGRTKYPLRKLIGLAMDGITSFSNKPLVYSIRLGLFSAFLAAIGVIWVLVSKLLYGVPVMGWASLMTAIFLFGGTILVSLGVIGTYLARIFDQVRNRPQYVIRDRWVSDSTVAREFSPIEHPKSVSPLS